MPDYQPHLAAPTRVLLLTEGTPRGGVSTMLAALQHALQAQGFALQQVNARQYPLWAALRAAWRCHTLLASTNFGPAYLGVVLRLLTRRRLLVWVHGPLTEVLEQAATSAPKRWLLRRVYAHVDRFICVSHSVQTALAVFAGAQALARSQVIGNAIAPASAAPPAPSR
ncbi:MAG: glycosyltransferase, partial [Rhodoferax sp.]